MFGKWPKPGSMSSATYRERSLRLGEFPEGPWIRDLIALQYRRNLFVWASIDKTHGKIAQYETNERSTDLDLPLRAPARSLEWCLLAPSYPPVIPSSVV